MKYVLPTHAEFRKAAQKNIYFCNVTLQNELDAVSD